MFVHGLAAGVSGPHELWTTMVNGQFARAVVAGTTDVGLANDGGTILLAEDRSQHETIRVLLAFALGQLILHLGLERMREISPVRTMSYETRRRASTKRPPVSVT